MAKKDQKNSLDRIMESRNLLDGRKSGASNEKKQEKTKSSLVFVTQSDIKIQEKGEIHKIELQNPSQKDLIEQLNAGECTLFFYKVTDGAFRRMRCTLQNKESVPSKYNRQGVIVVWDLDTSQWRSFYPNRVFKLIRNETTDTQ